MKKLLPLIMAAALTASVLSGCSGKQADATAAALSTEETTAALAEAKTQPVPAEETSPEESAGTPTSEITLRVGSLKGPTSMGLVKLMDDSKKGSSEGSYEFTMVTAADELLSKMVAGDLDIALVPANMASIIYNKTDRQVSVIDINTLGVLYVVSADDSIKSAADLKGRTVYLTGKGTTPDYALQYLLTANGLSAEDVTLEYKSEAAEVAAVLKEKPEAIGLLPQPFVTVAMAQNENLQMVLDLTKEWDNVPDSAGSLVTGVTIVRNEVLAQNQDAVLTFMKDHKNSAAFAVENVDETAELVAAAGIIEKAPIAKKALPYCSITYIDGEAMEQSVSGYLQTLFDMDPKTVGGTMPEADFYFLPPSN